MNNFCRVEEKQTAKHCVPEGLNSSVKENQNVKKKRKAPTAPSEHKPKSNVTDLNGCASLSAPFSISQNSTAFYSTESLTSSTGSGTDFSRSLTLSSLSGSVNLTEVSNNLSLIPKNVSDSVSNDGLCEQSDSVNEGLNETFLANKSNSNDFSPCRLNGQDSCMVVGDYVEKALLVSSTTSLISSSPNKSAESLNGIFAPHHPPRLASFESSSILHQEGLPNSCSATKFQSSFKPLYVTLDYVKSAASESREGILDDETIENGSLNSSLLSSIESEVGSPVESDVIESLYEKISGTVKGGRKNVNNHIVSPEVHTGDIKKDLFPLIFPGHSRENITEIPTTANEMEMLGREEDVVANNLSLKVHINNNNNSCAVAAIDKVEGNHLITEVDFPADYEDQCQWDKCENCNGVIINLNQTMDEQLKMAKARFGQCFCKRMLDGEMITELDYSCFSLKEVPEEIKEYRNTLKKLSLESNTITLLPQELFLCSQLEHFTCSDNDITELPPSLATLTNLKYLDFSKNVIEELPECLRCCKSLEILDASVNPLEQLSDSFTQLINLRELYMNDCFFEFLPANFGRLSMLRILELRDNQLQILPKSTRRLSSLKRLDLGGNAFQEWADVISKLTNLCELWLDCNELGHVPPEIGNLTQLTYLDLSRNFLESIPSQLGSLDHLTDLLLAENSIASLPDSIGFLYRLNVLNLEMNQLSSLPDSFGKLRSLEELDLSHNRLEHLPSSVGRLRKLYSLLLDNNRLSEIPAELGRCCNLNILQLSRNQIAALPDSVGNLTSLRVLNICQNRIPYLPESVSKLTKLEALWISPNQSKPLVLLQSKVDPDTNCQILTNVLLPQDENGPSRAEKYLVMLDEYDDTIYANDAADDDDLDAYAQRERGKTLVVFNLAATTYSDDISNIYTSDEDAETVELSVLSKTSDGCDTSMADSSSQVNTEIKITHEHFEKPIQEPLADDVTSVLSLPSVTQVSKVQYSSETQSTDAIAQVELSRTSPLSSTSGDMLSDRSSPLSSNDDAIECEPSRGSALRAWSSRSNLPSALIEQSLEWNPDQIKPLESVTVQGEIITAVSLSELNQRDTGVFPAANLQKKETVSKSNNGILSAGIYKSSPKDSVVVLSLPLAKKTSSENLYEGNGASSTNFTKAIDSDEEIEIGSAGLSSGVGSTKEEMNFEKNISCSADVPTSSENILESAKTALMKNLNSTNESTKTFPESKISSAQSIDYNTAADHDSGVGNDFESQGSITDPHEEASYNESNHKTACSVMDNKNETRFSSDRTSIRRNGGWIALVRTAKTAESSRVSTQNIVSSASKSQTKLNKPDNVLPQYRYVPPSSVDCTTVTYSHDYNRSKTNFVANKKLPPYTVSQANLVAEKIKKFETFYETHTPSKVNVSINPVASSSMAHVNLFYSRNNISKPVAIATVLPATTDRLLLRNNVSSEHVAAVPTLNESIINHNEEKNFHHLKQVITENIDKEFNVQPDDRKSPRRFASHGKKSKFDEALAATKHKHFRDKIEKMIIHKQPFTSISTNSGRRFSRGSTSSLASLPRITSPVPHHHASYTQDNNNIPVDHHDESKSQSIHNRLKEKLQLPSDERQTMRRKPTTTDCNLSRDRSGSVRQQNQRTDINRSSFRLRNHAVTDKIKVIQKQTTKKSLEEQLGQLLLDDVDKLHHITSNIPITTQNHKPAPNLAINNSYCNTNKLIRPPDWKERLLMYLERKKQESTRATGDTFYPPNSNFLNQRDRTADSLKYEGNSRSTSNFTRSTSLHSKCGGRRSSGRYQRIRTPGLESISFSNCVDVVVRPRSAMELQTNSFQQIDPTPGRSIENLPQRNDKNFQPDCTAAPPSYEDHILRRANTVGAVWSKQNYHDYVNVEYIDQLRSSGPVKPIEQPHPHQPHFPLRFTNSHDSVLNVKNNLGSHNDAEFPSKFSASQNSIQQTSNKPTRHQQHSNASSQYTQKKYYREQHTDQASCNHALKSKSKGKSKNTGNYGKIPSPPKTVKQTSNSEAHSKRMEAHHRSSGVIPPQHGYPHQRLSYADAHEKSVHDVTDVLPQNIVAKEDESATSAFRPYQHVNADYHHYTSNHNGHRLHDDDHHHYHHLHHQLNHYNPHSHIQQEAYYQRRQHAFHSGATNNSSNEQTKSNWQVATEPGVEFVTVTIRKNPSFGFHIMGGTDSGGNPYRLDDDGVFVTYVTPGGSADGLVHPGDKIILVNGSDFVGITHRRAVDLLRNAGLVAVLVLERLCGQPV